MCHIAGTAIGLIATPRLLQFSVKQKLRSSPDVTLQTLAGL